MQEEDAPWTLVDRHKKKEEQVVMDTKPRIGMWICAKREKGYALVIKTTESTYVLGSFEGDEKCAAYKCLTE